MTRPWQLLIGLLAGVVGAVSVASSADAQPSTRGPWIVRDLGHGVGVVAGHRTRSGGQNLQSLLRDWGPAATLRLRRDSCLAIWRRPAARVTLRSYGLPAGANYCSPKYGLISTIETVGPRWRTDRGLQIGDSEQDLSTVYPTAFLFATSPRSWGLRAFDTVGIEGDVTVSGVYARMGGATISTFFVPVGAEGE